MTFIPSPRTGDGWLRYACSFVLLWTFGSLAAQCPLACNGAVSMALGPDGTTQVTVSNFLNSDPDDCTGTIELTLSDPAGNTLPHTLNADALGLMIEATVTHLPTGNYCTSQLSVTDNLPPQINCTDEFIHCNAPDSATPPPATDNTTPSAELTWMHTDQITELGCDAMQNGQPIIGYTERTWTATDASGNSASCTQTIYHQRNQLSDIVFPPHHDGTEAPVLECGADDETDLSLTGQPLLAGNPILNFGSCEFGISWFDQDAALCGGARQINRTWIVQDFCTDQTIAFIQKIHLLDTTAPQITCVEPEFFNTYPNACGTTISLPEAIATDDCSATTVEISWQYGTGTGPFTGVMAGIYPVLYTATDACGNASTCEVQLTVADDDAPFPVCEENVQVNLQDDGTALVFAATFDNGSYDNCGIVSYEVSRDGTNFDEFVDFTCTDLGTTVPVTLRVADAAGNVSSCLSYATINDGVAPQITCPASVELGCDDDLNDLALTGQPFVSDNCSTTFTDYSDQNNLNVCGIGQIVRTWTATDASGNTSTCTQTISITDLTPMVAEFPNDRLLTDCGADTSTDALGEPLIGGTDCEQFEVTFTDYTFYDAYPACYKIIRNWAVIDWCTYQPNDPSNAGILEHTQIILVEDHEAPTVQAPASSTVGIQEFVCETYVTIAPATALDCSEEVEISNDSPYADNNGADASGVYPAGQHTITFTASDGCGNVSTAQTTLIVVDAQAPSPVCNNGVTVTLGTNGLVVITPGMIENGSSDNCTPVEDLILQVSPNTFDCTSTGQQWVTLSATDLDGNSAFCSTLITVQDNLNVCGQTNATVAGKMETEQGTPIVNKLVGLTGNINNATSSQNNGAFAFEALPTGENYTLRPTHTAQAGEGVSTLDIIIIQKHILGLNSLSSPYKMIAADVNRSGTITSLDVIAIRRVILNLDTHFPNGNDTWCFVPSQYEFIDPTNPLQEEFPEEITITNLSVDLMLNDFVGVKLGDVNGSNTGNFNETTTEDRSGTMTNILVEDLDLKAGYEYEIPLRISAEALTGFQLALDFEESNLNYLGFEQDGLPELNEYHLAARRNGLTLSYDHLLAHSLENEGLLKLRFRALQDGQLSDFLTLNAAFAAELYTGELTGTLRVQPLRLRYQEAGTELIVSEATPNPFADRTAVEVVLPRNGRVSYRLYDTYGRTLLEKELQLGAGRHRLELDLTDTNATGLLLLDLKVDGRRHLTRKMIRERR